MFQKTKLKKNYITAISMALVLLFANALGILINSNVGQITPPSSDSWANYATSLDYSGGAYRVKSAGALACLLAGKASNATIYLDADIDLAGHTWEGIRSGVVSTFYGQGHTISNLTGTQGLFVSASKVQDLTLANVNIVGGSVVGAVSGNGGTITNVTVSSGVISCNGIYVGGIIGNGGSAINCVNNATVEIRGGGYAVGGITGYNAYVTNCINTGDVYGNNQVGGIAGCAEIITNSYAECTVTGAGEVGGICGRLNNGGNSITNSGFKGSIRVSSANSVGSMVGDVVSCSVRDFYNNFAVADINLNGTTDDIANVYGIKKEALADNDYNTIGCSYSYSRVYNTQGVKEYRKYKVGSKVTDPFSEFAYHKNINGGYPFPKSLFAVGQFIESDVIGYLKDYGFNTPPVIKNDGTHYYVELGEYPQTYVGDVLNEELKSWFVNQNPVSEGGYSNQKGYSAGTITHYAYNYNGRMYVRVESATISGSGRTTQDGSATLTNGNEYWFKVEPIKWWVLNYTDVQNGAAPIVLAEQALTANVQWNKTNDDQNLWLRKSNIRTWLNESFYNDAFKVGYADYIQTTTVKNNSQSSDNDGTGSDSKDNVWLLSYSEVNGKYADLNSSSKRLCSPTDYALVNYSDLYTSKSHSTALRPNGGTCNWWLRSAGTSYTYYIRYVSNQGSVSNYPLYDSSTAVRPALTLAI